MDLNVVGGTGLTAYFGLMDIGQPKPGETVVVSAGAGATGSVVCQIAKHILGCRVVGIAGGASKCAWLLESNCVDVAIDYKKNDGKDFRRDLKSACPNGVDIFFDNVGGWILNDVLKSLNFKSRVVLCGAISGYNATSLPTGPAAYLNLISTSSRMEGFILLNYKDRFAEGRRQLSRWLHEGKIKYKEEVVLGLENAPNAMLKLFNGGNKGKLVVDLRSKSIPTKL